MKLKVTEIEGKEYAEVQDGKPVYVEDDGKELAFDAPGTRATITRLNGEAKSHRERAEAAEKSLKGFEGIEDPQAAIDALNTVSNLDHKKLVDAGEVEKVKSEISKTYQSKLDEANDAKSKLEQQLYNEKIGGAFNRSKFIGEKLAIPADMVQATFGKAFKVEDGSIVPYDQTGNKIFSRERPGEVATFDEAIEFLVDQYPHRDNILKGTNANGGGAPVNNGSGNGKTSITRAQYDAMSPTEQHKAATSGVDITD